MDLSNHNSSSYNGVSIVIPVINEEGNVRKLIDSLLEISHANKSLGIKEILFIDDGSTDKTKEIIKSAFKDGGEVIIKLVERYKKSGTVNAQLFGISQAQFNNIIIMDGDLQHPVEIIPALLRKYTEGYDLVLASRYVTGGSAKRTVYHGIISRGANLLAKIMLPWVLPLQDPISGFFAVNRRIVPYSLEMTGFNKLALYILSCRKNISFSEIPFNFKERINGVSKVSNNKFDFMIKYICELRYYRLLRKITLGRFRPNPDSTEFQLFRQN